MGSLFTSVFFLLYADPRLWLSCLCKPEVYEPVITGFSWIFRLFQHLLLCHNEPCWKKSCPLGMEKQSYGWKMMFPLSYVWTVRTPLPLLSHKITHRDFIFWVADYMWTIKMLALGCRFKVVVGVSRVCQLSQLYTAIDDLATRKLGSMMPSLFTLQAFPIFVDISFQSFFSSLRNIHSSSMFKKDR